MIYSLQDLMLGLAKMVEDCDVSEESYAFGKTKIFLKWVPSLFILLGVIAYV